MMRKLLVLHKSFTIKLHRVAMSAVLYHIPLNNNDDDKKGEWRSVCTHRTPHRYDTVLQNKDLINRVHDN